MYNWEQRFCDRIDNNLTIWIFKRDKYIFHLSYSRSPWHFAVNLHRLFRQSCQLAIVKIMTICKLTRFRRTLCKRLLNKEKPTTIGMEWERRKQKGNTATILRHFMFYDPIAFKYIWNDRNNLSVLNSLFLHWLSRFFIIKFRQLV